MPTGAASARRRRAPQQTRKAIIDALLAAVREGDITPTTKTLARRSGVSERTIFVHFPNREDLLIAVTEQQSEYVEALLTPVDPTLPLDRRIDIAVSWGEGIFGLQHNVRKLGLLEAYAVPAVDQRMRAADERIRQSLAALFAPELRRATEEDEQLLDLVDATTGWAYRHHLVERCELSPAAASQAVRRALEALLASSVPR
ncbi:TetR/AcrR family transcriptional regulator [Actinopolyspora mortivallis]|uniref:TetR/AcrR family transcriptional regulator n=1 Tax=Actinopolyspora mortivallis TaxID=33906 RepID=A0A2T0GXS1_ACTMO|nr:TetR/AcrR family transcriptional regulator [Actinopolyspora mortivallis]PRW63915.1 TetR/AcrR family transcriptional regulator [Actinopolyspora mortivallis]